jgi:hypothetical protein
MVKTNFNKGYVTQIIGPDKFLEGNLYHPFIVQSEFR